MPPHVNANASEFEAREEELRRRSDQILEAIAGLANLEVDKREARPGTAEFVGVASSIREHAAVLLELTTDEERLAKRLYELRERARGAVPQRTISEVPGLRPLSDVLAEWRAAERRLVEAEVGSEAHRAADADAARLRTEYQRVTAALRPPG